MGCLKVGRLGGFLKQSVFSPVWGRKRSGEPNTKKTCFSGFATLLALMGRMILNHAMNLVNSVGELLASLTFLPLYRLYKSGVAPSQ